MNENQSFSEWESGDCLCSPAESDLRPSQSEILKVISATSNAAIDWQEGDRWVNERIKKAIEIGYTGLLLEKERELINHVALVVFMKIFDGDIIKVSFFLTPDTDVLELHYDPAYSLEKSRKLAEEIGEILNYVFEPMTAVN